MHTQAIRNGSTRRRGFSITRELQSRGTAMTTRFLIGGALVVGFGLGWAVKGDQGVVSAQAPHKPFMMQRVYTGADGRSHVENIELNAQSVLEKVTGARVSVSQPGSFSDYHVGPERRYIINLTDGGQLQV